MGTNYKEIMAQAKANKDKNVVSSYFVNSARPPAPPATAGNGNGRTSMDSSDSDDLSVKVVMQTDLPMKESGTPPFGDALVPTHLSSLQDRNPEHGPLADVVTATPENLSLLSQIAEKRSNVKFLFSIDSVKFYGKLREEVRSFRGNPAFIQLPCDPRDMKKIGEKRENNCSRNKETEKLVNRWQGITKPQLEALREKVAVANTSYGQGTHLQQVAFKYNSSVRNFSFSLLDGIKLKKLLPFIIDQALRIEQLFPDGIPVLRKQQQCTLVFTQEQLCSILANAFLCTWRRRDWEDRSQRRREGEADLPTINFNELFGGPKTNGKKEKLTCILQYFMTMKERQNERQGLRGPGTILSFERRVLRELPTFGDDTRKLIGVEIVRVGNIEDDNKSLQVDFANSYVGGGVIRSGCVMEEIRFSICPELIAARLFTEKLEDNEVLIVTGCERFSEYGGYGDTFTFKGSFKDETPVDMFGRRKVQVVAMDALHFSQHNSDDQYLERHMVRELKKCYCAFMHRDGDIWTNGSFHSIATGHWGCGAFNGDWQLKFILQWIAASKAGRPLRYHTLHDRQVADKLQSVIKLAQDVSISTIFEALLAYDRQCVHVIGRKWGMWGSRQPLFAFLHSLRK